MVLRINGFPIDKQILLIDENKKSVYATLGCRNGVDVFVKEFHGDLKMHENSTFVSWCYPPIQNLNNLKRGI